MKMSLKQQLSIFPRFLIFGIYDNYSVNGQRIEFLLYLSLTVCLTNRESLTQLLLNRGPNPHILRCISDM